MADEDQSKVTNESKASGRRFKQVCYTCRAPFEPKTAGGHLLCPSCVLDSLRGGGRRSRPRF